MTSRGTTLIELIVSIVILGIMAGVTTLAIKSLKPTASVADTSILQARMRAIRQGKAVQLVIVHQESGSPAILLFMPDGRTIGTQSVDSFPQGR
ncbi:MAG: prepilin-type N-terminal cleavage/methylation domain-containing protein [Gemmatimonadota bacterium]